MKRWNKPVPKPVQRPWQPNAEELATAYPTHGFAAGAAIAAVAMHHDKRGCIHSQIGIFARLH